LKKKKLFLLFLITMLLLSTASCKSNSSSKPDSNSKSGNTSDNTLISESTEVSGKLKGKTITVASIYDNLIDETILNEINAILDSKLGCQLQFKKLDTNYYNNSLIAEMIAGTTDFDFIYLYDYADYLKAIKNNAIIPLDDYISFEGSTLYELAQSATLWGGKHYGLTWSYNFGYESMLLYNKEMLEQNALPDIFELQQKGLWTWDKFREIAYALTGDTDGDGRNDKWGIACPHPTYFFINLVYSNNTDFSTVGADGRFMSNIKSQGVKEAADLFHTLLRVDKSVFTVYPTADRANYVIDTGKAAIYTFGYIDSEIENKLHIAFYPKGPQATDYVSLSTMSGVIAIPSGKDNVESLIEVLKTLPYFSPDYYDNLLEKMEEEMKSANKENDYITLMNALEKHKYITYDRYAAYSYATQQIVSGIVNGVMSYEDSVKFYGEYAQQGLDYLMQFQ